MNPWDALVEGRLGSGFTTFWALCRDAWRVEIRQFIPAIVTSLALGFLAILPPILIAHLIDGAIAGFGVQAIGLLVLAVLGAFAVLAFLDAGLTWLRHRWTFAAQIRLRSRVAPKLLSTGLRQPLCRLQDNSRGTMIRSFDDLDETLGFISDTMPEFATSAVLAASYATLLFVVNPWLSVVALSVTALTFATAAVLARRSRAAFAGWIVDRDRAFTIIVDAFASLLTIKSMNAHRAVTCHFTDKLSSENVSLQTMRRRTADAEAVSRGWLTFAPGLVIGIGIWMVSQGNLSVGELVLFLTVSASLAGPVGNMCAHWEAAQRTMAAIARISELRVAELEALDVDLDANFGRDWSSEASLSLSNVGHHYTPSYLPVLHGVNLALKPGLHIAVTGRSGDGKTTLAHIIARLLLPSEGTLRVGANDCSRISLTSYRRRVLMLPHETEIFSASLSDNITLWDRSFSHANVRTALRIAGLEQVVDGLAFKCRPNCPLMASRFPRASVSAWGSHAL